MLGDDDWSGDRHERAEIFEFVRAQGITCLTTVCCDRHSFLAGVLSPILPPEEYRPVTSETLAVEFVAVPRPLERAGRDDGGPIAYRLTHSVRRWKNGESPRLERRASEGQLPLGLE